MIGRLLRGGFMSIVYAYLYISYLFNSLVPCLFI